MFEAAAEQGLALSFLGGPGDLPELDRMMAKHPAAPVILDHFMGCAREWVCKFRFRSITLG